MSGGQMSKGANAQGGNVHNRYVTELMVLFVRHLVCLQSALRRARIQPFTITV